MRFITGLLFTLNVIAWIFAIFYLFVSPVAQTNIGGFVVLLGFIVFLIAWGISEETVVAPADYFFQPEWEVFKKKIKWANGGGITITMVLLFLFSELL